MRPETYFILPYTPLLYRWERSPSLGTRSVLVATVVLPQMGD